MHPSEYEPVDPWPRTSHDRAMLLLLSLVCLAGFVACLGMLT